MGIKLADIQNLQVTEAEINLLAGLTATASQINILSSFSGSSIDLNSIVGLKDAVETHLATELQDAHPLAPNTLDGGLLADGTISEAKLSFDIATQVELSALALSHQNLASDVGVLNSLVQDLYGIVIPGQGNDLANAIQQCINHIANPANAHDASAISYGPEFSGYYFLSDTLLPGATSIDLGGLNYIRFFRAGDQIEITDDVSGTETVVITEIDLLTETISFSPSIANTYETSASARIFNLNEGTVQQGLDRSLKNQDDIFHGQLAIAQNSNNLSALRITNLGSAPELELGTGFISSDNGYNFQLKPNKTFDVTDGLSTTYLSLDTDGRVALTDLNLKEGAWSGILTKETLTGDRIWTLPDKSGPIGIGDTSFLDLLEVSANTLSGSIHIAPGFVYKINGEKTSAWIRMEQPSSYVGGAISLAGQLAADGELAGLGSNWLAFIVSINETDTINFEYSGAQTSKALALASLSYITPTNQMKLAVGVVQGDGAGAIINNTVEIIEDLRPFLNIGMSVAFYDESVLYSAGVTAGTIINLPPNSRNAGNQQSYIVGAAQLEIIINGIVREPLRGYTELVGSPIGQIAITEDLPVNSVIRFRIIHSAAGTVVGGGGGGGTLQAAYLLGPTIVTNAIGGPVTVMDGGSGKALVVNGDMELNGFMDPPTGYGLEAQLSEPGPVGVSYSKIWADADGDLVYKQHNPAFPLSPTTTRVIEKLTNLARARTDLFTNITGSAIPAFTPVALHPTIPYHMIPADVSSNTSSSRIIGLTTAEVLHGAAGEVILSGRLLGAGTAFAHNDLLFADPNVVGGKIKDDDLVLTGGNVSVILGTIDGNDLLVNIQRQGIYLN